MTLFEKIKRWFVPPPNETRKGLLELRDRVKKHNLLAFADKKAMLSLIDNQLSRIGDCVVVDDLPYWCQANYHVPEHKIAYCVEIDRYATAGFGSYSLWHKSYGDALAQRAKQNPPECGAD